MSKNYCAYAPEVELRFCPWLILFKYWTGRLTWGFLSCMYVPIMCTVCIEVRGLWGQPQVTGLQVNYIYTEWLKIPLLYSNVQCTLLYIYLKEAAHLTLIENIGRASYRETLKTFCYGSVHVSAKESGGKRVLGWECNSAGVRGNSTGHQKSTWTRPPFKKKYKDFF